MNAVVALVRANLRRLVAERSNLFFLVAMPLLIVFALGAAMGDPGQTRVGVVDASPTPMSRALAERVRATETMDVITYTDPDALRHDVASQAIDAGWIVVGDPPTIEWLNGGSGEAFDVQVLLSSTLRDLGQRAAAGDVLAGLTGATAAEVEAAQSAATARVPATDVTVEAADAGDGEPSLGASIQAVSAAGQLSLFVFMTSLNGAAYLLTSRQLGVTRRVRAGPVRVGEIVLGEAISRFVIALLQGLIIFFGTWWLFGVDWRDPGAVLALTTGMALVGAGGAMLLGSLARSEQQVGAVAITLSLALAALGGSMMPLEFFPDWLHTVALATPHGWMNSALWEILVDGAGLADVWRSVAGLLAAGVALLGVASVTLARTLR